MIVAHLNLIIRVCQKIPFINYITHMNDILCDLILTTQTKESLIEYCDYNDVHLTLNITFKEVLRK